MKKQHPTKREEKRIEDFIKNLEYFSSVQNYDKNFVYKKADEDGVAASVEIDEKYQRITLNIYPCFFNHSLRHQREFLIHEFVHVLVAPLQAVADTMLQGYLVTNREYKAGLERSTSAVTEIIVRLLMKDKLLYVRQAFNKYIK